MNKNKNKILYVYIARDERQYKDDSDHLELYGKLHVFYDTPQWNYNTCSWELARQIGGEIPGYMFPDIKEKECRKFISFANDHENTLSSLCDMYIGMKKMKEEQENDSRENKKQDEVQMVL